MPISSRARLESSRRFPVARSSVPASMTLTFEQRLVLPNVIQEPCSVVSMVSHTPFGPTGPRRRLGDDLRKKAAERGRAPFEHDLQRSSCCATVVVAGSRRFASAAPSLAPQSARLTPRIVLGLERRTSPCLHRSRHPGAICTRAPRPPGSSNTPRPCRRKPRDRRHLETPPCNRSAPRPAWGIQCGETAVTVELGLRGRRKVHDVGARQRGGIRRLNRRITDHMFSRTTFFPTAAAM